MRLRGRKQRKDEEEEKSDRFKTQERLHLLLLALKMEERDQESRNTCGLLKLKVAPWLPASTERGTSVPHSQVTDLSPQS